MSDDTVRHATITETPPLALALEQSHEVKAKVEDLAEDLSETNRSVEEKIASGATTLSAHATLSESLSTEAKVQECAEDLQHVTETLAHGITDLRATADKLTRSQAALVVSQTALAAAQVEVEYARHRASHDRATGLPNRELFDDRATHAIALAERHDWTLAMMFIDLDKFKEINDTHGHGAGDTALDVVAARLLECSRGEDAVCRAGGDEFLFLMVDAGTEQQVMRVATRIVECVSAPFLHGATELRITPSVGIAMFPRHGQTVGELVTNADAAMYLAKAGAVNVEIFQEQPQH